MAFVVLYDVEGPIVSLDCSLVDQLEDVEAKLVVDDARFAQWCHCQNASRGIWQGNSKKGKDRQNGLGRAQREASISTHRF